MFSIKWGRRRMPGIFHRAVCSLASEAKGCNVYLGYLAPSDGQMNWRISHWSSERDSWSSGWLVNRVVFRLRSDHVSRWIADDMEMEDGRTAICWPPHILFLSYLSLVVFLRYDSDRTWSALRFVQMYRFSASKIWTARLLVPFFTVDINILQWLLTPWRFWKRSNIQQSGWHKITTHEYTLINCCSSSKN